MNIPRFTAAASLSPIRGSYPPSGDPVRSREGITPALVGRWDLGTRCQFACIEVCTRFCRPTGWACCQWETRCALSCDGQVILTI